MESCVIFIPNQILYNNFCYLYGFYENYSKNNCSVFYVYDLSCDFINSVNTVCLLGVFNEKLSSKVHTGVNWLAIKREMNEVVLKEVVISGKQINLKSCVFVLYDLDSFQSSQLFLNDNDSDYDDDLFKRLAFHINNIRNKEICHRNYFILNFVKCSIYVLTYVLFMMDKICMFLKYSTFAIHLKDCLRNILSIFKSYDRDKFIRLHSGNYILATLIDMIIGAMILHSLTSVDDIFSFFLRRAENVIESITVLVEWLMGSPVGLKLNHPLNQIIGGFFLYNINLWWTFLGVVVPVLKYGFYIFSNLGYLGFSYQIAILADLFMLVTFHVYCIYVYAARLYRFQVQGLWSLSKLVIGKKRNPIPGRVDSCPYTTEQLFVGTISFTVLLFLLPTTLVYYIVFVIMRLGVVGICGLMTRTRYYIQIFPAYATLIWLFRPSLTAITVKFDVKNQLGDRGIICWKAKAIPVSWLETVKQCIPHSVLSPPPVKWTEIGHNITTGRLIYPL